MLDEMLSVLYPKKCVFCGTTMSAAEPIYICGGCAPYIPYYKGEYLFESGSIGRIEYCNRIICALKYEGFVRKAISGFKFHNRREYGSTLAALLCERFVCVFAPDKAETDQMGPGGADEIRRAFDFITCVPLSHGRLKERGYNQAAVLAIYMARYLGLPFVGELLLRESQTLRQSSLKRKERLVNVRSSFSINDKLSKGADIDLPLRGMRIVLVDDVATSMSTINACATALKAKGAAEVVGAVLAAP